MGSVAGSSLIVFVAFFISLSIVYSAQMDSQFKIDNAREIHEELLKNYYSSSVKILLANSTPQGLVVVIVNDGSVVLNPAYLSIVVDGKYSKILNYSVEGKITTVWAPGENSTVLVDYVGNFSRIKAITEFGSVGYYIR